VIPALIVVALVAVALVYIAAPIRRPLPAGQDPPVPDDALERKRAALSGLVDLEEEFQEGKLTKDDFDSLRRTYERDAIDALRDLDAKHDEDVLDDEIEREIADARTRLACPDCGAPRGAGQTCERCGA
jgi:hypothetical protein